MNMGLRGVYNGIKLTENDYLIKGNYLEIKKSIRDKYSIADEKLGIKDKICVNYDYKNIK